MPAQPHSRSLRSSLLPLATALVVAAGLAGCTSGSKPARPAAATARPKVLTVPEIKRMVEQGQTTTDIYGAIQGSGTVYRLTTVQSQNLRASGMPASLLGQMENTYQHAIRQNPDLAKSDERWTQVDGYWYGGLPYGWPREWVVGAPRIGEALR